MRAYATKCLVYLFQVGLQNWVAPEVAIFSFRPALITFSGGLENLLVVAFLAIRLIDLVGAVERGLELVAQGLEVNALAHDLILLVAHLKLHR